MDSIRQRFLQAEKDFLLAARSDDQLLTDFAERWQALGSDWESCLHEADHDTRRLVDGIVAKVEELAGDFYLFESHTRSLKDDLLNDLEDVFASLTLEENTAAQLDLVSSIVTVAPPSPTERDAISPAQWLLHNLHNPYPPPHVRLSEDQTTGSKHIKDWFSKARQRIGWTRLLRDRFAGCRSLATDAAFRAFVRDDPDNPLDDDLKTAFLAIKYHTELVYGSGAVIPQPSSKRLRSISPTPSLTFSSSSEDTDDELYPTSPHEGNSKRPTKRNSPDSSKSPPPKRRRIQSPSPPPLQPTNVAPPHTETLPLRSRKRRLSESDSDYSRPKRPRGIEDGRSHAVSDPISTSTVPTWFDFDQTFQIPNPASTSPPDPTSFDLNFFNPPPLIGSSVPAPSVDIAVPVDPFTALFEIPQLNLLQPALPSFNTDWTEFLNFEPDLSFSLSSPLFPSSLANTPPLVDDTILSPSSPPDSGPSSPDSLLDPLPHLSEKSMQFDTVARPMIQGQDFLLPLGDNTGISSVSALLLVH